jgi:hypothetical protein
MPLPNLKMKPRLAVELIAALLILVFVYTAATKLLEPRIFTAVLLRLPVLKHGSRLFTSLVPALELTIALMLFIHETRRTAFLLSFLLIALFTIYLTGMILFAPHLPCSCGGVLNQLSWGGHVLFNTALAGLSLAGYRLMKKARQTTGKLNSLLQ